MPPSPLTDLYALSLRTLDAHERRASELRGRVAPILAAGGLGLTLLSGPSFVAAAAHPLSRLAIVCAMTGLCAALSGAMALLLRRTPVVDVEARAIARRLEAIDENDDDAYAKEMIDMFAMRASQLEAEFELLHRIFTVIVCGTLAMLCGLALAALVG
ncbi:hypothetical protein [Conexibacter arvalis]|uniref:Uncharacterized protein n=1 Tax=Conexibacter arvalis TaxID=912552 RepID=A0A840IIV7_9ACTN|nr:hypothetical protein [Conexibacter arvalis]MBB4664161.1 hypothetical protein [Conexibacter arvalis]